MTLKTKLILACSGLIIAVVAIYFYYLPYRNYKEMKFDKEYSFIIKKVFSMKGYLYINDSLQVPPLSSNNGTDGIWLSEFIREKDVSFKKRNSDSVEIKRGKENFIFSPFVDSYGN